MTRFALLAIFLITAAALSGCGIRGDLDQPPPLWGADNLQPLPAQGDAAIDPDALPAPDVLDIDEDDPGYGIDVAE